uniref:Uncharacterized protein n=1 Tax=Anguilla anguilla TaxID=7936 RepID=A0A0E9WUA6_ANGAN
MKDIYTRRQLDAYGCSTIVRRNTVLFIGGALYCCFCGVVFSKYVVTIL